jgi:multicomponent Na+:H+ antiporter subunit D
LLFFAVLAFALLIRYGIYPAEQRSTVLNTDWVYRRALPAIVAWIARLISGIRFRTLARAQIRLNLFIDAVYRHHGPQGGLARTWPVGSTVLWVAVLLCVTLVFYYID